jgi:hypothetical protein
MKSLSEKLRELVTKEDREKSALAGLRPYTDELADEVEALEKFVVRTDRFSMKRSIDEWRFAKSDAYAHAHEIVMRCLQELRRLANPKQK